MTSFSLIHGFTHYQGHSQREFWKDERARADEGNYKTGDPFADCGLSLDKAESRDTENT